MLESVRNLVAEYSEFQRRRPDLPQGNVWGLSQDELEMVVAAFQRKGILMLTSTWVIRHRQPENRKSIDRRTL